MHPPGEDLRLSGHLSVHSQVARQPEGVCVELLVLCTDIDAQARYSQEVSRQRGALFV